MDNLTKFPTHLMLQECVIGISFTKHLHLPGPVLRLFEALLEAVLFFPQLQNLLLLRGKVDGLRDRLNHGVCQQTHSKNRVRLVEQEDKQTEGSVHVTKIIL